MSTPTSMATDEPRTLVLCFDGTGDMFDDTNTNVVHFFSALERDTRHSQLVYYQSGLGTYVSPTTTWAPVFRSAAKVIDMATASFLENHIMGGYTFLMENYREGDKICLFGFSRGAYTARCLAGMLQKVGLLPKSNKEQIPFAYNCYRDSSLAGRTRSLGFRRTFSAEVKIEFVGVWDTVSSVGILIPRHLPFASSNSIVKTFRHALALDERRARFKPSVWQRPTTDARAARKNPERGSSILIPESQVPNSIELMLDETIAFKSRRSDTVDTATINGSPIELLVADELDVLGPQTDVQEVWFAGCHADVGGGNAINGTTHSLAGPSLRWMIQEVVKHNTGIKFNDQGLLRLGINPDRLREFAPESDSSSTLKTGDNVLSLQRSRESTTSEIQRDIADAESQINDELDRQPMWNLLEIVPIRVSHQDDNGTWHRKWKLNLGRPRTIHAPNPLFHRTVKLRMDAGIGYKPLARYTGEPVYVD
ncbi:hypothetical protein FRC03_012812 [Tulasnella sp. 419]|nr:hypothetical protein FRC03_012812 [Tulasnella sp. 419]